MIIDNASALESLRKQKVELEQQFEAGREMYLKIQGAIDVLEQIEASREQNVIAEIETDERLEVDG